MAARFGKQLAEVRELFGIGIHKLNKAEAERDQALADVERLAKGLAEARATIEALRAIRDTYSDLVSRHNSDWHDPDDLNED